jgi:hypothetical protein
VTPREALQIIPRGWVYAQQAVNDPQVRALPGGVQQYMWQSLNNDYLSRGESLPQGSFQAVNTLLSVAGQQRQASLRLSEAQLGMEQTGFNAPILAQHIAPAIDAEPSHLQPFGPQYRITYMSQEIIDGEAFANYRTHDSGLYLPQSLNQLQSLIEEAAAFEAQDYGYEWGGVATPVAIHSY